MPQDAQSGAADTQNPAMNKQEVFRLMDLPPELRNNIYEHALIHCEANGIIAPAAITEGSDLPRMLIGDEWGTILIIRGRGTLQKLRLAQERDFDLDTIVKAINSGSSNPKYDYHSVLDHTNARQAQVLYKKATHDDGKTRVFYRNGAGQTILHADHMCTINRLREPDILRLRRQTRQEAKSISYSINEFSIHLMGDKFGCAIRWWRNIGDEALRSIVRFRLREGPFIMELSDGGSEIVVQTGTARVSLKHGDVYSFAKRSIAGAAWSSREVSQISQKDDFAFIGVAKQLFEGKLCVLSIERTLGSFDSDCGSLLRHEEQAKRTGWEVQDKAASARHANFFNAW